MKTAIAALLALGLVTSQASARTLFDNINDSAPHAAFDQMTDAAPRGTFDDLNASAPRSGYFGQLDDSAPRSDSVYGTLENSAP